MRRKGRTGKGTPAGGQGRNLRRDSNPGFPTRRRAAGGSSVFCCGMDDNAAAVARRMDETRIRPLLDGGVDSTAAAEKVGAAEPPETTRQPERKGLIGQRGSGAAAGLRWRQTSVGRARSERRKHRPRDGDGERRWESERAWKWAKEGVERQQAQRRRAFR